jgi:hypothetical protein
LIDRNSKFRSCLDEIVGVMAAPYRRLFEIPITQEMS